MKMSEQEFSILIIDDNSDIRERLSNVLVRRGYSVSVAENGLIGLQIALEKRIDIIFCDIYMPHMNGIEFLNKIRQINLKAEIIIVTGSPSAEIGLESFEKNAVELLAKPLTIEDILNALEKAEIRIRKKEKLFRSNTASQDTSMVNNVINLTDPSYKSSLH